MSQLRSSFVLAGIREHRRNTSIAAFCVLATGLIAVPIRAQSRNETHQPTTSSGQLLLARSKQSAGEYKAARDILLEAVSKAPNSASLLDALGSVQQDLGEYLDAERSYLRAL